MVRILPLALLALLPTSAAAAQDPLAKALLEHALLSRLGLQRTGDYAPFVLYLEAPRKPDPEHDAKVQELFGPWLAQIGETFLDGYIVPNSLVLDEDPLIPVVVMGQIPSFRNAGRYEAAPSHLSPRAQWMDDPGALITHWDASLRRVPAVELRTPVLYRGVEALIAAHHRGSARLPQERWVVDGLCGYLSAHEGEMAPSDLRNPPPAPQAMARLEPFLADPAKREAIVIPLAELVTLATDAERYKVLCTRAARVGVVLEQADALQLFRDQAALRMHYFHRGEGGRRLRDLRRYVAKVLHDNGGPEELASTFGVEDLAELDEAFFAHLDFLAGGDVIASAVPEVEEEGVVHVSALIVEEHSTDERLAAALGRAATGDVDLALRRLEAAMAGAATPDERERLASERDRLRVVFDARESFLASLIGATRKLRLGDGDEALVANVEAYADGVVTLGKNKKDRATIEAKEIAPGDLARSMGNVAADHGPAWLVPYLLLLAEDPRWDRKLDEDEAGGAALAAEAKGLVTLVHEGRASALLAALARTPLPTAPFQAEDAVARVKGLLETHGDTAAVAGARGELRKYVAEAWGVVYDTKGLENLVHGKLGSGADGRVTLTYEFDDAAEAEDFRPVRDYLADRTGNLFELETPESAFGLKVQGGNLEGLGHVTLRHPIAFEAPMTVRYELLYGRARPGKGVNATALLGICDDGQESYVGAWDVFDLECIDKPSGFVGSDYNEGERLVLTARTYKLELRHDGTKVELWVNGKKLREVQAAVRRSGALFFWVHSDVTLALRRLEIEGKIARGSENAARMSWIEQRVAETGF